MKKGTSEEKQEEAASSEQELLRISPELQQRLPKILEETEAELEEAWDFDPKMMSLAEAGTSFKVLIDYYFENRRCLTSDQNRRIFELFKKKVLDRPSGSMPELRSAGAKSEEDATHPEVVQTKSDPGPSGPTESKSSSIATPTADSQLEVKSDSAAEGKEASEGKDSPGGRSDESLSAQGAAAMPAWKYPVRSAIEDISPFDIQMCYDMVSHYERHERRPSKEKDSSKERRPSREKDSSKERRASKEKDSHDDITPRQIQMIYDVGSAHDEPERDYVEEQDPNEEGNLDYFASRTDFIKPKKVKKGEMEKLAQKDVTKLRKRAARCEQILQHLQSEFRRTGREWTANDIEKALKMAFNILPSDAERATEVDKLLLSLCSTNLVRHVKYSTNLIVSIAQIGLSPSDKPPVTNERLPANESYATLQARERLLLEKTLDHQERFKELCDFLKEVISELGMSLDDTENHEITRQVANILRRPDKVPEFVELEDAGPDLPGTRIVRRKGEINPFDRRKQSTPEGDKWPSVTEDTTLQDPSRAMHRKDSLSSTSYEFDTSTKTKEDDRYSNTSYEFDTDSSGMDAQQSMSSNEERVLVAQGDVARMTLKPEGGNQEKRERSPRSHEKSTASAKKPKPNFPEDSEAKDPEDSEAKDPEDSES